MISSRMSEPRVPWTCRKNARRGKDRGSVQIGSEVARAFHSRDDEHHQPRRRGRITRRNPFTAHYRERKRRGVQPCGEDSCIGFGNYRRSCDRSFDAASSSRLRGPVILSSSSSAELRALPPVPGVFPASAVWFNTPIAVTLFRPCCLRSRGSRASSILSSWMIDDDRKGLHRGQVEIDTGEAGWRSLISSVVGRERLSRGRWKASGKDLSAGG